MKKNKTSTNEAIPRRTSKTTKVDISVLNTSDQQ
jgi:hypothetical protein